LGKWYLPIGAIAVSWVTFIVVLLLFPAGQTVGVADISEGSFRIVDLRDADLPQTTPWSSLALSLFLQQFPG